MTGEEGEEILTEVKGVRLYIKRGDRPFVGGMVGTLRHLVHKETQDERLCEFFFLSLFNRYRSCVLESAVYRREPLWQPTMNARLSPTLLCSFITAEKVLRVARVDPARQEGVPREKWAHELVIYALKVFPFFFKKQSLSLTVFFFFPF